MGQLTPQTEAIQQDHTYRSCDVCVNGYSDITQIRIVKNSLVHKLRHLKQS